MRDLDIGGPCDLTPSRDVIRQDLGKLFRRIADGVDAERFETRNHVGKPGDPHQFAFDLPDDLWTVEADSSQLVQVFSNVLINAQQAMPNGGTLRITCESARGRRVAIVFSDGGVGIAPANLQRIFDLYFTTKEKGSGIGLSMVYRTVQMHDGEIEVQSTPGAGTTFRLLLPQA